MLRAFSADVWKHLLSFLMCKDKVATISVCHATEAMTTHVQLYCNSNQPIFVRVEQLEQISKCSYWVLPTVWLRTRLPLDTRVLDLSMYKLACHTLRLNVKSGGIGRTTVHLPTHIQHKAMVTFCTQNTDDKDSSLSRNLLPSDALVRAPIQSTIESIHTDEITTLCIVSPAATKERNCLPVLELKMQCRVQEIQIQGLNETSKLHITYHMLAREGGSHTTETELLVDLHNLRSIDTLTLSSRLPVRLRPVHMKIRDLTTFKAGIVNLDAMEDVRYFRFLTQCPSWCRVYPVGVKVLRIQCCVRYTTIPAGVHSLILVGVGKHTEVQLPDTLLRLRVEQQIYSRSSTVIDAMIIHTNRLGGNTLQSVHLLHSHVVMNPPVFVHTVIVEYAAIYVAQPTASCVPAETRQLTIPDTLTMHTLYVKDSQSGSGVLQLAGNLRNTVEIKIVGCGCPHTELELPTVLGSFQGNLDVQLCTDSECNTCTMLYCVICVQSILGVN
jgi:hypothetical protein